MRLSVFLATALILPLTLLSQVVPPTTDVSKSITALTTGMTVQSIAVDSTGNVYLAGTSSAGFPGATQTFGPRGDSDVFVVKTNATGDQILYAVSIGGTSTESLRSIKVDANGNAYALVSTQSLDFPNTKQFTPGYPIGSVIFKLNATGTALTYSTQLGSRTTAVAFDIDSAGAAFIGGSANSQDIATTTGVLKPAPIPGATDSDYYGFIVKLAPAGDTFQVATYYGASSKAVEAISVRSNGILISSNGNLALLNAGLTLQSSTVSTSLTPANMTFDAAGNIYLAGTSTTGGFRVRKFDSALTATALDKTFQLVSTTAPPRIAVAGNGRIYLFGQPISPQVFQTKNATQPCQVNIAAPNGAAGVLASDGGGSVVTANGQPLPPDQGMIILDTNGEILHATFLTAAVAQAAVAPSGKIYTAVTQTLFTTPDRTTWRGIQRFDPAIIPTEKASPSCIVHGAYFRPVPVTPGAILTIFGNHLGPADFATFKLDANNRVPTSLAGLTVTVDNRPAPLWFTYDKQINFIVPWSTRTDGVAVPVCVTYDGTTSCIQASTGVATPGAIVCDQATGLSCALNQDYSINWPTAPAAPGSVVQIFMTGYGTLNGTLIDGGVAGASLQDVKGTMTASTDPVPTGNCGLFGCAGTSSGFRTVDVLYAGAAPSLVLGANQVNIKIPADMPSGLQTFTLNFKPAGSTVTYSTDVKLQIR